MVRFPGPWIARFTRLWFRWHEVRGNREKVIDRLHTIYGPIVQMSPKQISVNGSAGVRDVYAVNRRLDRPPLLMLHNYGSENLVSTVNGDLHQERRKPLRTMYAARSIESDDVQRLFGSVLEDFTRLIDAEVAQGKPVDAYFLFRYLGCDIMSGLVYGPKHSLGLLRDEHRRQDFEKDLRWVDKRFLSLATLVMFWFPRMAVFLRRIGFMQKSMDESLPDTSVLKRVAREAMQAHRQEPTAPNDHSFVSHLEKLSTHHQNHGKSRAVPDENYILSDSLDHLTAGVTTTADALSAALYHLSKPENFPRQERLRTELKEHGIFPDSGFILEQAKKVGYLECIIKETLRLNPPIPASLERTVPAQDSIEVHGRTVTGGIGVSAQVYSLHRHQPAFIDPEVWNPERWDIERNSEAYTLMRRHFFAFGAGPRMCIGMNIAMTQLRLTLARIYSTYQTSLTSDWFDEKGAVIDYDASKKATLLSSNPKQMIRFENVPL